MASPADESERGGELLEGERRTYRLHGLCHTRSTPLGGRIPVQTCMDPPLDIPGVPPWTWWVEAAAHDRERVLLVIVRFGLETEGLPGLFKQAALIIACQMPSFLPPPQLRSLDP